ncbi:hypothetical protein OK348_06485 [Flavobacterium sp. MXW15]|uniref:DUF6630 domain-containing protein n=1 Tax=Xanthomonas chitinilytica TaxID=2989819 RepID=A0ABT3JU00_9XANT|nr:hypothetical protein [Xanthomonas sp. H13-6]MCW4454439.1 hypothetical protein [Flavobacterium sp. MXW15]MCW4471679.1 hypothetical protein [Xanthomonas sp. H13-6]
MPDNSADYEEFEDLPPEFDVDDHPARVWNLLLLINPGDEESALRQFDAWREVVGEAGGEGDDRWLWALKDAIDWQAGFHVPGDDAEALVSAIDELAARWNLRIDWGGDLDDEDFADHVDVPVLLATAYDRLREHGYSLWTWDTGDDTRAGWIALSRDDEAMLALSSLLEVEVRPGSDPF